LKPEKIFGIDISEDMISIGKKKIRKKNLNEKIELFEADSENLFFHDNKFDAVTVAFGVRNFEHLPKGLSEMHRVLKPGGRLVLVVIGQNAPLFNKAYRLAGSLVPAFWGRQVEHQLVPLLEGLGFEIESDEHVRQGYYPSRVMTFR